MEVLDGETLIFEPFMKPIVKFKLMKPYFSCLAVNYVAIAEALEVSPSVLAAGLAADNVICAVYFTTLFALASRVPAEPSPSPGLELLLP